jgi:hypothetical protein
MKNKNEGCRKRETKKGGKTDELFMVFLREYNEK